MVVTFAYVILEVIIIMEQRFFFLMIYFPFLNNFAWDYNIVNCSVDNQSFIMAWIGGGEIKKKKKKKKKKEVLIFINSKKVFIFKSIIIFKKKKKKKVVIIMIIKSNIIFNICIFLVQWMSAILS